MGIVFLVVFEASGKTGKRVEVLNNRTTILSISKKHL